MAVLKGWDVSHHNELFVKKHINEFRQTALDGFVIMKATEGVTWRDPFCRDYIQMLGELTDKQIGFYHYARPELNAPELEADNFFNAVRPYIGRAVLALDVEQKALTLGKALDMWVLKWLSRVYASTGVRPLVYIQKSALRLVPSAAVNNYGLWLPAWQTKKPRNCEPFPFIAILQNDCKDVDKNVFYGSKEQWRRYATVNR